jgi:hypothetical protein
MTRQTTRMPILIKAVGIIMEMTELNDRRVVLYFLRKTAYICLEKE